MSVAPLIEVQELAQRLHDPRLVILDATVVMPAARHDGDYRAESGRDRWVRAHIPGARFADLLGELSDHTATFHFAMPTAQQLGRVLRQLGVDDGRWIVVYDVESGLWAARLWWMLRSVGIGARVLNGGFAAWRAAGLPVEAGSVEAGRGAGLTLSIDRDAWVDLARVAAVASGEQPGTLVCALTADGFHGRVPTRYARRGHIPGSVLQPARDLFDASGCYLDAVQLAERAAPPLRSASRPLILYCGGGISAAANALALTLIGERDIAIYDGSLEEWTADPSRPVEL